MTRVEEVITVEGRDGTKRVLKTVDTDTYKTDGSATSMVDLTKLKKLQASQDPIVLTDPDFNGEWIRKIISEAIPGIKHAFIKQKDGMSTETHDSLGVEHATPVIIKSTLEYLYTQTTTSQ